MASLTDFATLTVELQFVPIGQVTAGMRLDVPFTGTATSSRWEGERPVAGVDYVTVGADGGQILDIRGRIGEGAETVAYRAIGRGDATGPMELFIFETANEELADLNGAIAAGIGQLEGTTLTVDLKLIER